MLQAAGQPGRDRELTVRPLRMELGARTPRFWMGGEAWETHLLNGMSLIFPPGERFFMRSVRALRDHVKDPILLEQVRAFLAQEALHSREHSTLNQWLRTLGLPAVRIERHIEERIQQRSGRRSDLDNLALTVALEHFTALLAKLLLNDHALRARFHETVLPLWYWHAIEELDHKAVAFDVYQAAGGRYPRRVVFMVMATVGLLSSSLIIQWHLMGAEGKRDPKDWLRGIKRYIGPKGHLAGVMPEYFSYYKRDFHPWQHDDRALIARAERELHAMLADLNLKSA